MCKSMFIIVHISITETVYNTSSEFDREKNSTYIDNIRYKLHGPISQKITDTTKQEQMQLNKKQINYKKQEVR